LVSGGYGSYLSNRLWGLEANVVGFINIKKRKNQTPTASPSADDPAEEESMDNMPLGNLLPGFGMNLGAGGGQMFRIGWLCGVRYLRFDERLEMFQVATQLQDGRAGFFGEPLRAGDSLFIDDLFLNRTQFWGPQIGAVAECKFGPAVLSTSAKIAVGNSHQVLGVHGSTQLSRPGQPTRVGPGGLLAVDSNGGRHSTDVFAVVPELGLSLGFQPIRNCRATVGYNFLYCSSVLRAGDQVNRIVSPTQVPSNLQYDPRRPPLLPSTAFDQTDFWAQGLNFSLELRF
jgi:hypothetical protein